jgi:hypothetical protein
MPSMFDSLRVQVPLPPIYRQSTILQLKHPLQAVRTYTGPIAGRVPLGIGPARENMQNIQQVFHQLLLICSFFFITHKFQPDFVRL